MQIRTLILIVSFVGAMLIGLVTTWLSYEREFVQSNADAEIRWDIYSEALDRYIEEERENLKVFGLAGRKRSTAKLLTQSESLKLLSGLQCG
jgi:hypothetical protein